jgi:tRNA (cmo5U34)-methyltransferase
MLKKCEANLRKAGVKWKVAYENQDLNNGIEIRNASVVIFCLTLQFLRPLNREKILKKIAESLPENDAVIFIEWTAAEYVPWRLKHPENDKAKITGPIIA